MVGLALLMTLLWQSVHLGAVDPFDSRFVGWVLLWALLGLVNFIRFDQGTGEPISAHLSVLAGAGALVVLIGNESSWILPSSLPPF